MSKKYYYSNLLERFLNKPKNDFNRDDIIRYILNNEISIMNFHYVGGDGRLKSLNFPVESRKQLETVLSAGERVDGSSLFKNIETGSSDLYVVPKYRTCFYNPFSEIPAIGLLCRYFDKDGTYTENTPDNILLKANQAFTEKTGYTLEVMGELEYYVISEKEQYFYAKDQRGYHESPPFTKWECIRNEAIVILTEMGCKLKYGHSEVGNFSDENFNYEQNELEFMPVNLEQAAEELILGKWVLRNIACQYDVNLSFAPKIATGKAGSGMHVHMRVLKDGKPVMGKSEELSDVAIKSIAGILELSPSLTAFGNTVPVSYLRLVPHQEAPTNICWGYGNRSALVRVPLGWTGNAGNMIKTTNPDTISDIEIDAEEKRTFEFRCPDGSADLYLLIAGLAVAARHGIESENAIQYAKDNFIDVNIFKEENKEILKKLKQLPGSCSESADYLLQQKDIYTKYGVFSEEIIKSIAKTLKSYNDKGLSEKLYGKHDQIKALVDNYIDC